MNVYAYAPAKGDKGSDEGPNKVHARGSSLCDMETLCGYVWSGHAWVETRNPVTCLGCLDVISLVRKGYRAKT